MEWPQTSCHLKVTERSQAILGGNESIREVQEETGLAISIEELIGVYTKYFAAYPNGDQAQTIAFFYKGHITGGELAASNEESLELKFYNQDEMPELFNQQHADAYADFKNQQHFK